MLALDPASMGLRVAEARSRAGLTQADLAAAASLDRSALAKIETGARRLTASELARIADAVDERIEWFVTETPPAIVSRRNSVEPGTASPAVDRLTERAVRNVEFLVEHDRQFRPADVPELERPGSSDAAEAAAAAARDLLGVGPDEPLTLLAEKTNAIGALAFSFIIDASAADGASILLPHGAVALVNGSLHVGRRRLTLAHELGHCLFADEYTVDRTVADHTESDVWEARLDRFARALLLPAAAAKREWDELRAREDVRVAAVRLASRFRVDMSTLARRLTEIDAIDAAQARTVRVTRTTRADIVEFDLLNHDELAPPQLPRSYEQSVVRLYRSSTVSAARATDLMFDLWNEEDLPELPPTPDSAIWGLIKGLNG